MMKLNSLITHIKDQVISIDTQSIPSLNLEIKGLSLNSKLVREGHLFFCLSGSAHKGSNFINEAYKNGAKAVMLEEELLARMPKDLAIIRVKDVIRCLGLIAEKFYGYPFNRLNTVAVTGTNGKTSTTFIIERVLKTYRKQVGVMGTINYRFGRKNLIAKNTTPDILTIYSTVNEMLSNNVKYVVMEVSSHALSQRRVEGLRFNQAIFTNLSQDHFDYHKTKKNYFAVKTKLFTDYLKKDGIAIINGDDDYGIKLKDLLKRKKIKILTYGIEKKADIMASDISLKYNGSRFSVQSKKHKFKVETNLIGLFNIYNSLAAVSLCLALDVPEKIIVNGLKRIYVPGRLELIRSNNDVKIFVDYAHTEDALKNALLSLRELINSGRLIVVFGCGGDRDKDKRHKMGRVASELADFVIITSDNPRFEDPKKIIRDIRTGIHKENSFVSIDRRGAIEKAIDMSRRGDIILVAGKGHEGYQIVKDKSIVFNDRKVIEEVLSKRGFAACLN